VKKDLENLRGEKDAVYSELQQFEKNNENAK